MSIPKNISRYEQWWMMGEDDTAGRDWAEKLQALRNNRIRTHQFVWSRVPRCVSLFAAYIARIANNAEIIEFCGALGLVGTGPFEIGKRQVAKNRRLDRTRARSGQDHVRHTLAEWARQANRAACMTRRRLFASAGKQQPRL